MFQSKLNTVTGKMEWVIANKDYESLDADMTEEFSRSQYGDMLHDTERNKKYYEGLKWAIDHLTSKGIEPRVLDIGTGTGLLSMMAARCGAKKVTACEVLKPMVRISRTAIEENGYGDIIKVIPKRSTDLTVGPGGDMKERANILVTEVFDSELIGEGAVPTFRHANQELLEDDAIVIPSIGTVFIELVESEFLWHSHTVSSHALSRGQNVWQVPSKWGCCPGPATLWDIHLEEISDHLTLLSASHQVASFSFSDPSLPIYKEYSLVSVPVTRTGTCHALAVWWTLKFAPGVELSMSPWEHNWQWRDHWLPCVQLLPHPIKFNEGGVAAVQCISDKYTMWTVLHQQNHTVSVDRPACRCGVHLAWCKSRLRMVNDRHRTQLYLTALDEVVRGRCNILCVSDGAILPLLCKLRYPDARVTSVETNPHSYTCIMELLNVNELQNDITVLKSFPNNDTVDMVYDILLSEPWFISSSLPWHNLHYWYVRSSLAATLSSNPIIMPCTGYLKAVAVTFDNLHLLKAPVGVVEGFDITAYDRAVDRENQAQKGSLPPEDYSLWEYPCYSCSDVVTLMEFDFNDTIPTDMVLTDTTLDTKVMESKGRWSLYPSLSCCHGVVLWMEYRLLMNKPHLLSTGLLEHPSPQGRLSWSTYHNQGVAFFIDYTRTEVKYSVKFHISTGEMVMEFV